MNFEIKSQIINDYILLTATGKISDIDEFKLLNELYFKEINKNQSNKIIVDEISLEKPLSLINMIELTDFYGSVIADKISHWQIAVIVEHSYQDLAKFWENQTDKVGYNFKIVLSMEEALNFINL